MGVLEHEGAAGRIMIREGKMLGFEKKVFVYVRHNASYIQNPSRRNIQHTNLTEDGILYGVPDWSLKAF